MVRAKYIVLAAAIVCCEAAWAEGEYEPMGSTSAGYDRELRKSEWVYLDVQGGLQAVNLQTFRANEEKLTAGIVPSSGVGPAASVGLGLRLVFVTLGVRARVGAFDDTSIERSVGRWQTWSLDGEIGLRVPLGRFEPYFRAYGGYTTFGSLDDALT